MTQQKRRVIYVSDEAWEHLRDFATGRSLTMSEAIRQALPEAAPGLGDCAYCGEPGSEWDHVIPRTKGGSDDPANLVPACRSCNRSKGPRTPEEWMDGIGRGHPDLPRRSISMPVEHWSALDEIAKREDRSVASLIRLAVGAYLLGRAVESWPDTNGTVPFEGDIEVRMEGDQ